MRVQEGGGDNVGDTDSETESSNSDDDLHYGDLQENYGELKKLFKEDDNEGENDFLGF